LYCKKAVDENFLLMLKAIAYYPTKR